MTHRDIPAALGYAMPAEWEPHRATWLAWPHNRDTWPGKFEPIVPAYERMVRTLSRYEPVHILAAGAALGEAGSLVGSLPQVVLHEIPTNDCWIRDYGPTFVRDPSGAQAIVDWQYNAWGGKYPPFDRDAQAAERIGRQLNLPRFAPPLVLEGGSIDVNGRGTLLTTDRCLLNPNRNPHLGRDQVEQYLRDYLGVRHVVWLAGDLAGDDTDGHVDQLARFVDPTTVVAAAEDDPRDDNYEPLRQLHADLAAATDQDGRPLTVLRLPLPRPKYFGEHRLPASYANFYIANGVVLVPQFDDPADVAAADLLARCFPDRRIEPLPALDLVWGLGAFHCMTQQQPQ
jgi:agmatine deiminase